MASLPNEQVTSETLFPDDDIANIHAASVSLLVDDNETFPDIQWDTAPRRSHL